jgi:hypothetical protein
MLHAGIGLAFAEALLEPLTVQTAGPALRHVVKTFGELCRENSQPGYIAAAYESLGLVTRSFHAPLVQLVYRELQQSAEYLLEYYWHGVGRAIYFSARSFLPCAEIDWEGEPGAAPDETGRSSITAGLAWAVTLVNMRQPIIMEHMLRRHGDVLSRSPAFADGVASSLIVRSETTPDADFIGAFCSHQPDPPTGPNADLWNRLIGDSCRRAVLYDWPALARARRLDTVF